MPIEIAVEHNPSPDKLEVMGVFDWAISEQEAGAFSRTYERKELCYILEGSCSITPTGCSTQHFKKGDLISLPKDLECLWIVTKPVKMHCHIW